MPHAGLGPLKRFAQELAGCSEQEAMLLFAKEFMACREALKDFNPSNAFSRHETSQALLKLTVSTLYSGKYAAELLPYAATLISSKNLAHKTVGYQVLTYVLPHMPVTIWEHFLLNSLQKQLASPSVDDRCLALQFMANNMPPSTDLLDALGPMILPLLAAKKQPYDVTTAAFKICCKFVACARDSLEFLESPVFLQICTAGLQASRRAMDHHAADPARPDRFIVMRTATAFVHSFAALRQEVDLQQVPQFREEEASVRKNLSAVLHDCVHSLIACYYFVSAKETFPENTSAYHTVLDPFWQIEALQTIQLCSEELNREFSLAVPGRAPPKARRRLQEIVRYMLGTSRRVVRLHGAPDQSYSNIRAAILLEVTNVAISFPYMQAQSIMQDVCYRITNLMGEARGRRSNLLGMKHLDLLLERNAVADLPSAFMDTLRRSTIPYLEGLLRKTGLVITECAGRVLGREEGDGDDCGDEPEGGAPGARRLYAGKRPGRPGNPSAREGEEDDTITLLAASRASGRHSNWSAQLAEDAPRHYGASAVPELRVSGQHLLLGARVILRLTGLGLYPFSDCAELLQPLAQGGQRVLQDYSLSQLSAMLLETLRSKELLRQLDYFDLASYVLAVLRQRLCVIQAARGAAGAGEEASVPRRAPSSLLATIAAGELLGGSEALAARAFRDLEAIAGEVAEKYAASGNQGVYDLHMLITGALEAFSAPGAAASREAPKAPQGSQDREVEGCITVFCSQVVLSLIGQGCLASCDPRVVLRMCRALAQRAEQLAEWEGYSAHADSCALASLFLFTFLGDNDRTIRYVSHISAHMSPACLQMVTQAIGASENGAQLRAHFLGDRAAASGAEPETAAREQEPVDVREQIVLPAAPGVPAAPEAPAAEVAKPAALEPLIEFLES